MPATDLRYTEPTMAMLPDTHHEVTDQLVFKWNIESWSETLTQQRAWSPAFACGGQQWRVLIFPNGNKTVGTISAFLESLDAASNTDDEWHICASFVIGMCNYKNDAILQKSAEASHRYTSSDTDWGFSVMFNHSALHESDQGAILEDDKVDLFCVIRVLKDENGTLWHNFAKYNFTQLVGTASRKLDISA